MEQVILWEAPPIIKPEFRLYYGDRGQVLFYTCDKPEGSYLVVDAITFAECNPYVKVIDGKLVKLSEVAVISKLIIDDYDEGVTCASEDISIVVDETYEGPVTKWSLKTHELG
jgi:hypothetical protein